MKKLLLFPFTLLAYLVGRISWSAPPWVSGVGLLINCYRRSFLTLVLLAIVAGGGFLYLDSLPKPVMVKASASAPGLTPNHRDAIPDSIRLRFEYDYSILNDDQPRPSGDPSVARIDLVGETVSEGITLSPLKEGKWIWRDDRILEFKPTSDWAAGVDYEVRFETAIFSDQIELYTAISELSSRPFKG